MAKEDLRNLFEGLLQRHTDEGLSRAMQRVKQVGYGGWRADMERRFQEQIEPALLKVEEEILQTEPIASIEEVVIDSARAIEDKSRVRFSSHMFFDVKLYGRHPGAAPHAKMLEFVESIFNGYPLSKVVDGFYMTYESIPNRSYGMRDRVLLNAWVIGLQDPGTRGSIGVRIGDKITNFAYKDFNVMGFADYLATEISQGAYQTVR